MDISLKRFTLTAIAAAVLTLHAQSASAISCPAFVTGTALAGTVCDFDGGTGSSVSVENGGEVGGISMVSYNPLDSSITIKSGGSIIDNGLGGVGILVSSSSSLTNGISNGGTINISQGTGIAITSSSIVTGGISNSGMINTQNTGISIVSSGIGGGIHNSGLINSTNGTGIRISSSSIVTGGISNTGTIRGGGVDVGIAVINQSILTDGIFNSGLIESDVGDAIIVNQSIVNDGIYNTGTIRSASSRGIDFLNSSGMGGNIFNSGTISGGTDGISLHNNTTMVGDIQNLGTIHGDTNGINIFSGTTIAGSISNGGTITGNNIGLAVTSSALITGGITNSGTIQGDILAIRVDSNSSVDHIDIVGQRARVIGNVEASTTTFNVTNGAVFTSEGSFNVDVFNVGNNAVFNMANTITANNVNNMGILAVNNSQNIIGNYTQNTNGTFQTGITSTTNYGQLAISGTADLSQSGNIFVNVHRNNTIHNGDVFTNVMSGGVLIGPTNGFNVTDNSFIWKFTASNTGAGVNLMASIDPVAYTACQGAYCQGAANVIIGQVAAGNPSFGPFSAIASQAEFTKAVSQATPELVNENIQVTQLAVRSALDVVPMWSALHGKSAGDAMLYQPGKIWLKPYVATMRQDQNSSVQGFHASAYGLVLGRDVQIKDWLFGGALAAGKDNMRGNAVLGGQSVYSDVYQAIIYGARKLSNNFYLAAQGLLGYGNNDSKRSIPLYSSTARGNYNSWFGNARAQLGWNIQTPNPNLMLTPVLDANYLYINQESFNESGSVMALRVASNNDASLILGAYGNLAYQMATLSNQQHITLSAYVGIARNLLNSQPQTTATFVAGGPSFSTPGAQFNNTVYRGGLGVAMENPNKPLRASLNYDLQTGNNAYSGVGSLTIIYKL